MDKAPSREQQEHAVLGLAQRADGPGRHGMKMAVTVAKHDEAPDTFPLAEGGACHGWSPVRGLPRR